MRKKKLENKLLSKNTIAGFAFAVAGLASAVASVNHGISSYNTLEKAATKSEYNYTDDAMLNYNADYNAGIAEGALSLIMGTSAISCYCFSKRRFLVNKKK